MTRKSRKRAGLAAGANPETDTLSRNHRHHDTPIVLIQIYRWTLTARGPQCRVSGAYPPDLLVEIYRDTMSLRMMWCDMGIPFDPIRYSWRDEKGTSNTLLFQMEGGAA